MDFAVIYTLAAGGNGFISEEAGAVYSITISFLLAPPQLPVELEAEEEAVMVVDSDEELPGEEGGGPCGVGAHMLIVARRVSVLEVPGS